MKKSLIILSLFILVVNAAAGQFAIQRCDTDCARLTFQQDTVNYGNIAQYSDSYYSVKYKNTGRCPLIIWSVNGLKNHRLTINKHFLRPGDSGLVNIFYPTDTLGRFFKSITFYSNAAPVKALYLKGDVVHDAVCARMKFTADTINFGQVHYVFGKHFALKIPSTGTCPLMMRVSAQNNEYFELIDYSQQPVAPGDSGIIDIHIGGQVTGHYYGLINITSPNGLPAQKLLFIKATFMPPGKGDSNDTEIKTVKDIVNTGYTHKDTVVAKYYIINTGNRPLVFKNPAKGSVAVKLPDNLVDPGKTCKVSVKFSLKGTPPGPFIKHFSISGNFKGKNMPLYIEGVYDK